MKHIFICFFLMALAKLPEASDYKIIFPKNNNYSGNIFIITVDGYRWQELFKGADSNILNNTSFTSDKETLEALYGGTSFEEKRKKLMPFMWNIVAKKGQLYGNRTYDNNVNVSNFYSISYPGYSEIFTGKTDITIATNNKNLNPHQNIFEYLNNKDEYKGKIALFTSWDVFPFILNEKRSGIRINSGYENAFDEATDNQQKLNIIQTYLMNEKGHTRNDMLTYIAAKEYLVKNRPTVFYLGLGETDEYAHAENYDMYLQKANETDKIIAALWQWAQTTEGYKNNTTFVITTDHGRGSKSSQWISHGPLIKGSSQTWLALLGKNVTPLGEIKTENQFYQKQLAQTIASFLGEEFGEEKAINAAIAKK